MFIVLDGVDGCGKSTQAELLIAALTRPGAPPPLHLREPGSTALGEGLRALVLSREHRPGPEVEALIMAAARRHMLDQMVAPALAAGRDVVCERFHPSTFAYQGVAGGAGEEPVWHLLETWAGHPRPDLEILLLVPPEAVAARRLVPADRIEDKGLAFQREVAEGYRRYAARAERARVVDAGLPVEEVAARVLAEVRRAS